MIYLINTTYYDKKNSKIIDLLKIGYTGDLDSRMKAYFTTNPEYTLLQTREGDTSVESYLHKKFEKYRYKDSEEWFYYDQYIVDNFQCNLEDFIDKDILLDCIKKDIRSKISSIVELKKNYLNQILEEVKSLDDFSEELYDEEKIISNIVDIWENGINQFNKGIDNISLKDYTPINLFNCDSEIDINIISQDLPQILGRQRLDCNPWKNRAELYAKFLSDKNKKTGEEFKSYQENKISKTRKLLDIYDQVSNKSAKHVLAEKYQKGTKAENYRDDYVAVNVHAGSDLIPVFNNLVMISEMRAFEIQQIDFADRFRTFNSLNSSGKFSVDEDSNEAANFLNIFNSLPYFTNKMKLLCTTEFKNSKTLGLVLGQIPIDYSTIYNTLSLDKIKALCYKRGELMKECNKVLSDSKITSGDIKSEFAKVFIVGEKYTIAKVKNLVREVYDNLGFNKSPKAVDILDYFEVLKTRAKNETGEKFVDAYKILKLKE